MSVTMTTTTRVRGHEHFEPDAMLDPQQQRQLRSHLEEIDYATFASNREIVAKILGHADAATFEKLASVTSQARAHWVAAAIDATASGKLDPSAVSNLAALRTAYEELSEAYEAMRRMVERGYLTYQRKP